MVCTISVITKHKLQSKIFKFFNNNKPFLINHKCGNIVEGDDNSRFSATLSKVNYKIEHYTFVSKLFLSINYLIGLNKLMFITR